MGCFVVPIFQLCQWASNYFYRGGQNIEMLIHYDTIEDGFNKTAHLLYS